MSRPITALCRSTRRRPTPPARPGGSTCVAVQCRSKGVHGHAVLAAGTSGAGECQCPSCRSAKCAARPAGCKRLHTPRLPPRQMADVYKLERPHPATEAAGALDAQRMVAPLPRARTSASLRCAAAGRSSLISVSQAQPRKKGTGVGAGVCDNRFDVSSLGIPDTRARIFAHAAHPPALRTDRGHTWESQAITFDVKSDASGLTRRLNSWLRGTGSVGDTVGEGVVRLLSDPCCAMRHSMAPLTSATRCSCASSIVLAVLNRC